MTTTTIKIGNILKRNFFLLVLLPIFIIAIFLFFNIDFNKIFKESSVKDALQNIVKEEEQENENENENEKEQSENKIIINAIGMVEPESQIISISTHIAGVISKIYVVPGDDLKKGSLLFTIDNREARADYEAKNAAYNLARIELKNIKEKASEFNSNDSEIKLAKAKLNKAKADLELARIIVKKLTVRSPIKGKVLKVNSQIGEYANIGKENSALMTIGNLDKMNIRIEVDENNAHKIKPNQEAFASFINDKDIKIPLEFVRIEPKIVNSNSSSNDKKSEKSAESENRVLEIIYGFANKNNAIIGQKMNVEIYTDEPQES